MCLPHKPFKVEREWVHMGLTCTVTIAKEGQHRCGYVRVPPGHPLHGKSFDCEDNNPVGELEAHGGVNFAELEPCTEHADGQGWWFGFDCSHCYDCSWDPNLDPETLSPETRELYDLYQKHGLLRGFTLFGERSHYWTEPEVVAECERLADQLAAVEVAKVIADAARSMA